MFSNFSLIKESEKVKKRGELGRKMAEEALEEFEKKAVQIVKRSKY